ncbi:16S rRNA (cytosine(967)-C(5))-methyltransferase [Mesoplasma melaleucae]|uniref:16S rRNA (cytosine(967)-C(5))-methyltransferase n=1 Tax=Mesoplasma melaleucae TaxID=81459 RepID=A0A2K8NVV1_9MOLU|nr:16S rRNA (cytosine(967)-C(5))-methyltransferase RsmB [Mesoplasma melaleucae]ATZ17897.1 16S rRNA (cytosine(967)-C(5))-methyltransferase [Mesoplasma melaleucae]
METNNSRKIAFEILKKVFKNKSFSNILLNDVSKMQITEKFKNLIFAIVHGTITNQILLDQVSRKLIDVKKTNINVQILLWMSIYQIRFLKTIPQYAIVNESVIIAKSINHKFSGLMNACLKKVINSEEELFDFSMFDEERRICIENSFPKSLFNLIKKGYGIGIAKKVAIDSNEKPVISFRVNTLKTNAEDFYINNQETYELEKTTIKDCLISKKAIVKSPSYVNGEITIQDPASILVSNVLNPSKDTNVLDMCSAPGGKLTHLSMLMENTGHITAYEISENKIKLIKENIERLGCTNIDLKCGDATLINQKEFFDHILLDAPCSGFGVLKRKPEIKINNIEVNSIKAIVDIQEKLLDTAYFNLKTNGTIVYSTCTINPDENQNQIKKFISKYKNIEIVEENQLFGYEMNTDGFYICKMMKK